MPSAIFEPPACNGAPFCESTGSHSLMLLSEAPKRSSSMPASRPSGSFQRVSVSGSGGRQTALLITVLPPTHLPCRTWNRASEDIWSPPSA